MAVNDPRALDGGNARKGQQHGHPYRVTVSWMTIAWVFLILLTLTYLCWRYSSFCILCSFPYILGVLLPISESGKRPSSMNTRLLQMGLNLAASLTQDKWIVIYHASENFNLRSQAKFNGSNHILIILSDDEETLILRSSWPYVSSSDEVADRRF